MSKLPYRQQTLSNFLWLTNHPNFGRGLKHFRIVFATTGMRYPIFRDISQSVYPGKCLLISWSFRQLGTGQNFCLLNNWKTEPQDLSIADQIGDLSHCNPLRSLGCLGQPDMATQALTLEETLCKVSALGSVQDTPVSRTRRAMWRQGPHGGIY